MFLSYSLYSTIVNLSFIKFYNLAAYSIYKQLNYEVKRY